MNSVIQFLIGLGVILIISAIIWFILRAIAGYKIFKKAGEKGWKAWIPFLNGYVQYKFTWKTVYFWIVLALAVASAFCIKTDEYGEAYYIWPYYVISAAIGVFQVIENYKLAKAFGKGCGFTVGLVLLNPIFLMILGFGSAEYIGNSSVSNKVEAEEIRTDGTVVDGTAHEVNPEDKPE